MSASSAVRLVPKHDRVEGDWPFDHLRPLSYGAIIADPPWKYDNWSEAGERKNPKRHYRCLPLEEIQAFPVHMLGQRHCALFMWATAPMLPQAIDVMRCWGFRYVTAGPWAKQSSTGEKWAFGTGYVLRSAAEFFLVGTIGTPRWRSKSERNLIIAPTREHSRKPDELHAMVERLVDGPYCELFARSTRQCWASWGDQVGKFVPAAPPTPIEIRSEDIPF